MMPKINVYLPDELADAVKEQECQSLRFVSVLWSSRFGE